MPARDRAVPPMGEEALRVARRALWGGEDRVLVNPGLRQGTRDGEREIERRPLGMPPEHQVWKVACDLRPDGVTAGMNTRTDHGNDLGGWYAPLHEMEGGISRNPVTRAAPPRVDQRARRAVPRDERHGGAIGSRDGDPRVSGVQQETVCFGGPLRGLPEARSMDLAHARWPGARNSENGKDAGAIREDRPVLVSHAEAQVEGRVGPAARSAASSRQAEPRSGREVPLRRAPDFEPSRGKLHGHTAEPARFRRAAQAVSGTALFAPACLALAGLLAAAGCARAPKASSGSGAREQFFAAYAAERPATRGIGSVSLERGDEGRGKARVRWASNADSLAVVGYAGPSRALDGVLKGDSLYLVIRHYGIGVAGSLRSQSDVDPRLLAFLVRPWDFHVPWIREAIERATLHESDKGWLFSGILAFRPRSETYGFSLEINPLGEPVRLVLRSGAETRERISIRYGRVRRFEAGRIPSWIEWKFSGSLVRLEIEDYAPVDPSKVRYAPPAESGWMIHSLDAPEGRALVRWLLGFSEEDSG